MPILMPSNDPLKHIQNERILLAKALRSLVAFLGSTPTFMMLDRRGSTPPHPDAQVEIRLPGAPVIHFACVIKPRLASPTALQLAHNQLGDIAGAIPLVVTQHLTRGMLDWSRDNRLCCLDASGNGHIEAPGLLLHIRGNVLPKNETQTITESSAALTSPAGLRMLFVCLTTPLAVGQELSDFSQRELARMAGISLGSVNRILDQLEANDFLVRKSSRTWHLIRQRTLVDFWLANYPIGLRPKLAPARFSGNLPPNWWDIPNLLPEGTLIGGEVAQWLRFHAVQPATASLFVPAADRASLISRVVRTFRLKPDPQGNVEVLDRFWKDPKELTSVDTSGMESVMNMVGLPVVPDLLIGADLMNTPDSRLRPVIETLLKTLAHDA